METLEKYFLFVDDNWKEFARKQPGISIPDLQESLRKAWFFDPKIEPPQITMKPKVKKPTKPKVKKLMKPKVKKPKVAKEQPFFPGLTNPHMQQLLSKSIVTENNGYNDNATLRDSFSGGDVEITKAMEKESHIIVKEYGDNKESTDAEIKEVDKTSVAENGETADDEKMEVRNMKMKENSVTGSGVQREERKRNSCLLSNQPGVNIRTHKASQKPVKFVPPKKVVCDDSDCSFCNAKSCKTCRMCVMKKKCLLRRCPALKVPNSDIFTNCASLAASSSSEDTKSIPAADKADKVFAQIMIDDIGRDYTSNNWDPSTEEKGSSQTPNTGLADIESAPSNPGPEVAINVEKANMDVTNENHNDKQSGTKQSMSKCDVCGQEFKQLKSFHDHKCGLKLQKISCPSCGKEISRVNLAKHIKLHSSKKYQCDLCTKTFTDEAKKINHMKCHADTTCSICGKTFARALTLREHAKTHNRKTHTEERNNEVLEKQTKKDEENVSVSKKKPCRFCEKQLMSVVELTKHMKTEHQNKAVNCNLCASMFFSSKGLKSHLKMHTYSGANQSVNTAEMHSNEASSTNAKAAEDVSNEAPSTNANVGEDLIKEATNNNVGEEVIDDDLRVIYYTEEGQQVFVESGINIDNMQFVVMS